LSHQRASPRSRQALTEARHTCLHIYRLDNGTYFTALSKRKPSGRMRYVETVENHRATREPPPSPEPAKPEPPPAKPVLPTYKDQRQARAARERERAELERDLYSVMKRPGEDSATENSLSRKDRIAFFLVWAVLSAIDVMRFGSAHIIGCVIVGLLMWAAIENQMLTNLLRRT
jgi:hypothetical protein